MQQLLKRKNGFTLAELILILFLMGILSMLTVPKLTHFHERWILRSTAHMLANDIRKVQRLSVHECTPYNFELHTTQFYYMLRHNDPTGSALKKTYFDPKITSITSTLKKYSDDSPNYKVLQFSLLGSPNQAGEIRMKTIHGETIYLTVDVTTGRVLVYD